VESEVVDAAHRAAFRIMDVNLATSEEARSLVEAAKVVSVYVTRWDCASNTALHSILFPPTLTTQWPLHQKLRP
jgi:hypothetical protein